MELDGADRPLGEPSQSRSAPSRPPDSHWVSPPRRKGLLIGGALSLSAFGLAVAAVWTLVRLYPAPWSVAFAGVALLCAGSGVVALSWTASLASLRYNLRGAAVYIQWGGTIARVPLRAIQQVVPQPDAVALESPRGLFWPGIAIGFARLEEFGETILFATERTPSDLLLLITPMSTVGITAGTSQWAEAISQGAVPSRAAADDPLAIVTGWRRAALWDDSVFWWLGVAGVGAVLLNWGLALARAPAIAELARYLGTVRIDRPDDLVTLAGIGAAILLIDLVVGVLLHGWDTFASRLLILSGVLGQAIIFFPLLSLG